MLSDFIVGIVTFFFDVGIEGIVRYLEGDLDEDQK
jgi:hypothetical protein